MIFECAMTEPCSPNTRLVSQGVLMALFILTIPSRSLVNVFLNSFNSNKKKVMEVLIQLNQYSRAADDQCLAGYNVSRHVSWAWILQQVFGGMFTTSQTDVITAFCQFLLFDAKESLLSKQEMSVLKNNKIKIKICKICKKKADLATEIFKTRSRINEIINK